VLLAVAPVVASPGGPGDQLRRTSLVSLAGRGGLAGWPGPGPGGSRRRTGPAGTSAEAAPAAAGSRGPVPCPPPNRARADLRDPRSRDLTSWGCRSRARRQTPRRGPARPGLDPTDGCAAGLQTHPQRRQAGSACRERIAPRRQVSPVGGFRQLPARTARRRSLAGGRGWQWLCAAAGAGSAHQDRRGCPLALTAGGHGRYPAWCVHAYLHACAPGWVHELRQVHADSCALGGYSHLRGQR
jgi:hypothetical protein